MHSKKIIIILYCIFILCGALSLVYIPDASKYSYGSIFALFIISLPLFYTLYFRFGINTFIKLIFSLSLFALLIEYVGLVTGWPYGEFLYTGNLGYKLFGILPWTVGLSWTPLVVGSVAMVYPVTQRKVLRIILPVIVLVVFDLLLDPVAVNLGMWSYLHGGAYYSVPIQNFFGWIFSGLIGSLICFYILNKSDNKIFNLGYSLLINIIFWSIVAWGLGLYIPLIFGIFLIMCFTVIYFKNNERFS